MKTKPRYTIIEKNIQRWQPGKGKEKSPDPASYHVAEAIENAQWPKKRENLISKTDRVSVFDTKKNKVPGVAHYFPDDTLDRALKKTSKTSPLNRVKRH